MSNRKKTKLPPCIYARKQLMQYASLTRFPDGWLPPERVLSEEIGVSRGTLRKALGLLIEDGYVVSIPQKGNFITGAPRRLSIGAVIGNGALSETAISAPHMISGIMDELGNADCAVRFFDIKNPENIEEVFQGYDLDGLIWCYPPAKMHDAIANIIDSGKMPLVIPTIRYKIDDKDPHFRNYVTLDYAEIGRARAEYFIKRGHKRIAYLGDNPEFVTYRAFVSTLAEAGAQYNPDWHIVEINQIAEELPKLLTDDGITAVVSNGGPGRLESLFCAIEKHAGEKELDLLIDQVPSLSDIMFRHPGVCVNAVNILPHRESGRTAAKALLQMLNENRNVLPVFLNTHIELQNYKINHPEK